MNLDDQAASAVMAYVQAGKRGADLLGAIKCAIEAAVLAEREACAKVCDKHAENQARHGDMVAAEQSRQDALAIRARSNDKA